MKSRKLAFITGASGGIGSAISEHFIRENYFVHGIDIFEESNRFSSENYQHHTMDITNFSLLSDLFKNQYLSSDGNVLVNCAGIREICSISELSLEQWETIFAVNVTAAFVAAKSFCQNLVENDLPGTIVNIASVSGLLGEPNRTAYVSAKHAVIGLTKQLSIEYGKSGIRVNAVAPGVIRTPLTEQYYHDKKQMKKIDSGQFIKHRGMPSDVAQATYFLASDQANFITGSTVTVDGGWTAGKNI